MEPSSKESQQQAASNNVYPLHLAPRPRAVPALTDAEILKLRQLIASAGSMDKLLEKAETVLTACPVAQRILSTR